MAIYKYAVYIGPSTDAAFDQLCEPGTPAPWPGIYRCHGCGHEIAIAATHTLPQQNHHQHTAQQGRIQWRLVVSHTQH